MGLHWGFSVVPLWVLDGPSSSTQRRVHSTSPAAVDGVRSGGASQRLFGSSSSKTILSLFALLRSSIFTFLKTGRNG